MATPPEQHWRNASATVSASMPAPSTAISSQALCEECPALRPSPRPAVPPLPPAGEGPEVRAILSQGVLYLAQDPLLVVGQGGAEALGEPQEQLALLVAELGGHGDAGADQEVAASAAVEVGHSLAPQDKDAAGLGAGRHLERVRLAVQRGHLRLAAQGGLRQVQLQIVDQVVLVALELRVRPHGDADVEVAGPAAVGADVALAGEPHLRAVADAGGDLDQELAGLPLASGALAVLAGVGDDPALAPALGTGGDVDELTEEVARYPLHVAAAVAGGAAGGLRPRLRAGAGAAGAGLVPH